LKPSDKSRRLCSAIALVLHQRREACGFTQTKLADLSGITRQMISYVEQSKRIPTVDTLAKLAAALNLTPSSILAEAESASGY
jgi:transcriptional regulator with XRE-family HTH domain